MSSLESSDSASIATPIVIVEDDTALRGELAALFTAQPDFRVIATFADAASALAGTAAFRLGLVDLGLPDGDGADVIRGLRARWPDTDFMAYTVYDEHRVVFAAIIAGASGYVLKGARPDELVDAMRLLRSGGAPMSPRIARAVIDAFRSRSSAADHHLLTARERDVLVALEEGLSYKETAARLHLSYHTVHTHIKRIYEKLQATSKQEAMIKARERGCL